jgi:uncharacterized protein YcfL
MKKYLILLIGVFILIGCDSKQQIPLKIPNHTWNKTLNAEVIQMDTNIYIIDSITDAAIFCHDKDHQKIHATFLKYLSFD